MMFATLLLLIGSATAWAGVPEFEDDPAVFTADENVFLRVRCSATGDPDPLIKWYNEAGSELGPDSHPPVEVESGRIGDVTFCDLIFNVTVAAHTGLYTCTAESEHGLRSKIYNITIHDSSGAEKLEIVDVTSTSVTFSLDLSGNKKMLEVTYIEKVEDMVQYSTQPSGQEIVIKNLIPSGHYKFNFTLRQGQESKMWNATVVLLPSVPEVIFRHLADGMVTVEWFKTIDDIKRKTIDKYRLQYLSVQMQGGNGWLRSPCNATIELPTCLTSTFSLANLQRRVYYEIVVSAHTSAGYGMPYRNKVYLL